MALADILRIAIALGLSGVLAWAAVSDVRRRRIPNRAVLGVLMLVAPWLLATGVPLVSALAAGLIALAAGFALFLLGILGAGDAKLFSSLALCAGLAGLPTLALGTALAGGLVAVATVVARPTRALVLLQMRGAALGRSVPYGVAIAVAGALVLWSRALGLRPIF
jgi:prepilin peptidase CpaA